MLEIVAVHVPPFTGVTTSVNVSPEPDGVPNDTIAVAPVPHVGALTETVDVATVVVTVTVCANVLPTPENVRLDGETLSSPGCVAVPVVNGGGFAPPF